MRVSHSDHTTEKAFAFLAALTEVGSISRACLLSGFPRKTAYELRGRDESFAAAWDEARRIGMEAVEDEAIRRAHEGVLEPVYFMGICIDQVRKYSDTLMIFLLKGAMPHKYRDQSTVELSTKLTQMSPAEKRAEMLAILKSGVLDQITHESAASA